MSVESRDLQPQSRSDANDGIELQGQPYKLSWRTASEPLVRISMREIWSERPQDMYKRN